MIPMLRYIVRMKPELARRIDLTAKELGMSRAAFVRMASTEKLREIEGKSKKGMVPGDQPSTTDTPTPRAAKQR